MMKIVRRGCLVVVLLLLGVSLFLYGHRHSEQFGKNLETVDASHAGHVATGIVNQAADSKCDSGSAKTEQILKPVAPEVRDGLAIGPNAAGSAAVLQESRSPYSAVTRLTTPDDGSPLPDVNSQIADGCIAARVQLGSDKITLRKEQGYDVVDIKGCRQCFESKPGSPMLPVREFNVLIPTGMKVTGVRFAVTEKPLMQGADIFPSQPPQRLSATGVVQFVQQDAAVYGSDEICPACQAEVVGMARMRGNRFLTIRVAPVRYRPKSRELLNLDSVRVDLDVEPDPGRGKDLPRHPKMDAAVKSSVINAGLMDAPGYGTAAGEVAR